MKNLVIKKGIYKYQLQIDKIKYCLGFNFVEKYQFKNMLFEYFYNSKLSEYSKENIGEVCLEINENKIKNRDVSFYYVDHNYSIDIDLKLNSKIIRREKNYMVYIKESEKISDFLRLIKSYNGVMYFEDIRIYRDHKNMTNRLNNCEQANMDKIFITANNQIKDIEKLKKHKLIDTLEPKIKEVIEYRLKYPESSLSELANIMTNELGYKISKSGLNHRFRKIKTIVSKLSD